MYTSELIWVANNDAGEHINILPKMANRHGLVAGATGTGKTVTLKVLAESFSAAGVPVFIADVKGDVAGMMQKGTDSENMQERIKRFGLADAGFEYKGCPVTLWDLYGEKGIQLRTTVSEVGPLLMSRILGLNDLQSALLTIVYKIADDNDLMLIDTKDLKAMLNFVNEHADELSKDYGKITSASIDVITRSLVALEMDGGDKFFGEPNLDINDWIVADNGPGMIHILDSSSLVSNGKLYSTFLLWMLAELFETLPEVGDPDKPKMVFFFDEAHLLFSDVSKALMEKIEQVIKLIRSKGVGIYFCTQNPSDIPSSVLSQLGNKIQHALRAFTPAEQKGIKAAADSFRENPAFDSKEVLTTLGTGEALVSFLDEKGTPQMVEKANILPPQCSMDVAPDEARETSIKNSKLAAKYAEAVDNESAYEQLNAQTQANSNAVVDTTTDSSSAPAESASGSAEQKPEKPKAEKEDKKPAKKKKVNKATRDAGRSAAGTVGREIGKEVFGKAFGKKAARVGGNAGAAFARGLMDTFLKR